MEKLTLFPMPILCVALLLFIPDYTPSNRFASGYVHDYPDSKISQYEKMKTSQGDIKENPPRTSSDDLIHSKQSQDRRLDRGSRQWSSVVKNMFSAAGWAKALKIINHGTQAACVAAILGNLGCGGLKKDVCLLRKEVANLRQELVKETITTMNLRDAYQNLEDVAIIADSNNNKIVGKLHKYVDTSERYLQLLGNVKADIGNVPVPIPAFLQLDKTLKRFILDLDNIPQTTSNKDDTVVSSVVLGVEILPYLGALRQKNSSLIDKTPRPTEYDVLVKKEGQLYAVTAETIWAVNKRLNVIKQTSINKLKPPTLPEFNLKAVMAGSVWKTVTGAAVKLTKSVLSTCMDKVLLSGSIALCSWQISTIMQQNIEAKDTLTKQKKQMTLLLTDLKHAKSSMAKVVNGVEQQVYNHSENLKILNKLLLGTRSFYRLATADEVKILTSIDKTKITGTNLVSNQYYLYTFLAKHFMDLGKAFDYLQKWELVGKDVKTESTVDIIVEKLKMLHLVIAGKLEIYQIIAKLYPEKVRYDGITLSCIRDGTIGSESKLEVELKKRVFSQPIESQLATMAYGRTPVNTIIRVLKLRFKITTNEDQVLAAISKSSDYASADKYIDFMGKSHALVKYRSGGSQCT